MGALESAVAVQAQVEQVKALHMRLRSQSLDHPLIQDFRERVETLWRSRYPRRKSPWVPEALEEGRLAWTKTLPEDLPDLFPDIRQMFSDKGTEELRALEAQEKALGVALFDLAAQVEPQALLAPCWSLYHTEWNATWATQGYGMETYARARATYPLEVFQGWGLEGVVRRMESYYGTRCGAWEVWVSVRPEHLGILQAREGALWSEEHFVRWCWTVGRVNPRVYHPMIPPGFEEAHGIPYC